MTPDSCETSRPAAEPVAEEAGLTSASLFRLMALLSPGFPVGAFTYSHGLEQVIEDGDLRSAGDVEAYLTALFRYGSGQTDAILLRVAHAAASAGDDSAVLEARDFGLALAPSRERLLETSAQGTAFLDTCRKAWCPTAGSAGAAVFARLVPQDAAVEPWPYPVAVGLTAAAWGIPAPLTLTAYLQAFAASLISATVRAVPLGQTDGQRVLHRLEPVLAEVARHAGTRGLSDIGSAALGADIASMRHETQYTRLFRS
ncbi:urease accessory protein UreF [Microvirga tunisiensis]|uniref:Urease accessory protein UreF n=2 Tax=Pannonibacter tanglangensis TaxID=2750084 RepID=A0ABW9ZMQ4_9HYPH|nr:MULTISPECIES: urease accessory protein UreF [unclassified Pannonibacter]NBN65566.1 urease accessory protein UreF [Pannonibacter sp. XCT-34]NBN80207.1 urease accessory protein UreF [Pannonibacter sp. XCT-53]